MTVSLHGMQEVRGYWQLGRGRAAQACLDVLDAAFELGSGLADRAGHDVAGAVAPLDVGQALSQIDGLTGRAGGHVAVGERHRRGRGLVVELGQLGGEAAQLGLGAGARVVGDQAGKALVAERAEVAGTVERVEAGLDQGGGVAEVMQVGGGNQVISLFGRENGGHPLRLSADPLHVMPAVTERRQQFLGVARRPIAGPHA
jgi:hypothetical protein